MKRQPTPATKMGPLLSVPLAGVVPFSVSKVGLFWVVASRPGTTWHEHAIGAVPGLLFQVLLTFICLNVKYSLATDLRLGCGRSRVDQELDGISLILIR